MGLIPPNFMVPVICAFVITAILVGVFYHSFMNDHPPRFIGKSYLDYKDNPNSKPFSLLDLGDKK